MRRPVEMVPSGPRDVAPLDPDRIERVTFEHGGGEYCEPFVIAVAWLRDGNGARVVAPGKPTRLGAFQALIDTLALLEG